MMINGYLSKWLFFISSYFPLYLLLFFEGIDYSSSVVYQIKGNWLYFSILAILVIISIYQMIILIKANGAEVDIISSDATISPENESLMNYLITYITPILSLDINDNKSIMTNGALFCIIGLIYVGSTATFLNPLLGILGYKLYSTENFDGVHHIISRMSFFELEKVRNNQERVLVFQIGEGVATIKIKKEKDWKWI